MNRTNATRAHGFSLLELLVSTAIFITLSGAIFGLLVMAQQRYHNETEVLDAFQQASLAMDQMIRDVHTAGYPPLNSMNSAVACANLAQVAWPFGYSPNYPEYPTNPCPALQGVACTVGGTCETPTAWDLIVEENVGNGVQWIRYQLNGTTLLRGVANKVVGANPATVTAPFLVPYVDNVMNNAPAAQMALIRVAYPGMFPGNTPAPLFTYSYDTGAPIQPPSIREVNINLIVESPSRDPKTGQVRVVTLTGQARRINPNQ